MNNSKMNDAMRSKVPVANVAAVVGRVVAGYSCAPSECAVPKAGAPLISTELNRFKPNSTEFNLLF